MGPDTSAMLSIHLENLFKVGREHGLNKREFLAQKKYLPQYLHCIFQQGHGFYGAIDDKGSVDQIERFATKKKRRYRDIVLLGIGGSALGAICLKRALTHLYLNELSLQRITRLHVLDNVDPVIIREIQDVIHLRKTLFIVVSKSGGTSETLSQYFYFRRLIKSRGLSRKNHFAIVTDPREGFLRKIAIEDKIPSFSIPPNVGGRFSVLTAAGLLPAAFLGINLRRLLQGAKDMRSRFFSVAHEKNFPFQLASIQYLLGRKGKTINVLMPYAQKLTRFTDWYRQLLAESIGKDGIGLTPIRALGSTDQHSQLQLYNDGPNDKLFLFIEVENYGKKMFIPNLYPKEPTTDFLHKTYFDDLMRAQIMATRISLTESRRPNLTIFIEKVDEYHLGALFMLFEASTAFLGQFFNINAFDQPGVERAKELVKDILRP